ncbi:MAG: isoaspartyl peptidase/L-asparaginase [Bosea sp.]|jgi:beta-aspartyl-peptidase (threonine type)|nr:isoaspartyl peptidase/L-asparaginase [Bosea sp. (in: a-proteobacteria)]
MSGLALGLHGGCGTLDRSLMSEAEWTESREHIAAALRAGWRVLAAGGHSLDAVQATIMVLEDSPHFNAGHGAALTEASTHELDASIMDGATLAAGAVCATTRIRNPIAAARALLDRGQVLLLAGPAADHFAETVGLTIVEPSYFTTARRVETLATLKRRAAEGTAARASEAEKHGTVGAVARDANGNLAAGTSTGGFNNKPVGRVGDSPIIGAGTYARNGVCAVSCTGMGEYFIRNVAAYDVAARIMYGGASVASAAGKLVHEVIASHGIGAGMIVLGATGDPIAPFNTLGMYRGWVGADGEMVVATHQELHWQGRAA